MSDARHVLVDRTDITTTRIERTPTLEPAMGEILVRINRVAVTSNNITYAVVSDRIPYFELFPAPPGWGRVPVWGFGDIVASNAPGLEPGERLYGFWPMSTHILMQPDRISSRFFIDGAEHRAQLPVVYNSYSRVATDETYEAHQEGRIAVFRPLFLTAFTLDGFMSEAGFFEAEQVVVSSASSKTAWILAYLLARRSSITTVALTSNRNHGFVNSLDLYDAVHEYDDLHQIPAAPTVYVDFSGNSAIRAGLRRHLGKSLVHDYAVGLAHWDPDDNHQPASGPAPTMFFAPAQFMRMVERQGAAHLWLAYADAWRGFLASTDRYTRIIEKNGIDALVDAYTSLAAGDVDPARGVVVRF
ncbi:MAG: DUF2855 family protein [Acidimicrobiia bacterium]|nr:DUF2855 family protein [Acidimicrobiia bacterium]